MQQLSETTKSDELGVDRCAKAMLDGMPQVMWFIRREMRRNRNLGLSVPQFRTLVLLDRYPHTTLSCVAENLGSTLPTASRIVSGLVKKRMIRRGTVEADRRQAALVLTPRGRSAFEVARIATQGQVAGKVRMLSAQERETVVTAMRILDGLFANSTSLSPLAGAAV